jgi:general secretion pathway protein D
MSVGEKVPTVSGVSATGSGALAGLGIPIQNITYQDVKLKFSITPHVNDDNKVRLEIDQDINELGQQVEVTPGNKQWHIRTKAAKTTISAKDQQTVVLGGLIDQRQTNVETKIPILGDIPIIGHLFKHTSKEVVRKNLLLVLTPYVIRSDDDLRKIHERKNREREEFGKLYFGDKITRYDPYVDYDKKSGPLSRMIREVGAEMQKTENGGPGLPGEIVIKPPEKVERKDKSLDISIPDAGGSATMSDPAPENIEPLPGDFRGEDPFDDVPSLQDQGDIPPPPPPPPPPPENIQ